MQVLTRFCCLYGKFIFLCAILTLVGVLISAQISRLSYLCGQMLERAQPVTLSVPTLEDEIREALRTGAVQIQTSNGVRDIQTSDTATRERMAQAFRFEQIREVEWHPTAFPAWEPSYILHLSNRFRILWESDPDGPQVVEVFKPGTRREVLMTLEVQYPAEFREIFGELSQNLD